MSHIGADFEKEVEAHFPLIRKRTGAFLYRLYPPTRGAGMRGTMPVFVIVGRAVYDVAGWMRIDHDGPAGVAQSVGIELKASKQRHSSLPIVGEDGHGSGIQAHQLEALAALHRDGGIARILWNNGGVIGIMYGETIQKVFYDYGVSLAVERLGKKPALGSRSIKWGLFVTLPDFNDKPEAIVLPEDREPTVKETLAAKRRKASKLIEEAERAKVEETDAEDIIVAATEEDEDDLTDA